MAVNGSLSKKFKDLVADQSLMQHHQWAKPTQLVSNTYIVATFYSTMLFLNPYILDISQTQVLIDQAAA